MIAGREGAIRGLEGDVAPDPALPGVSLARAMENAHRSEAVPGSCERLLQHRAFGHFSLESHDLPERRRHHKRDRGPETVEEGKVRVVCANRARSRRAHHLE